MTLMKVTEKERGREEIKNESDVGKRWKDERILESAPHLHWDMKNIKRWEKTARGGDRTSVCSWRGVEGVENFRACPLRRSVNLNATACSCLCSPFYVHANHVCKSSTSPYVQPFRMPLSMRLKGGTPSRWEGEHVTCLQRVAVSAWEEDFHHHTHSPLDIHYMSL